MAPCAPNNFNRLNEKYYEIFNKNYGEMNKGGLGSYARHFICVFVPYICRIID